jgi:hypothetical protein
MRWREPSQYFRRNPGINLVNAANARGISGGVYRHTAQNYINVSRLKGINGLTNRPFATITVTRIEKSDDVTAGKGKTFVHRVIGSTIRLRNDSRFERRVAL